MGRERKFIGGKDGFQGRSTQCLVQALGDPKVREISHGVIPTPDFSTLEKAKL